MQWTITIDECIREWLIINSFMNALIDANGLLHLSIKV
jgi:hypothetical protein